MIQFKNVSVEFEKDRFALQDVNFTLQERSFTFLTGHSGAGKSTLLKLIARLERPSAGEISLNGIRYSRLRKRQEPTLRRQMGIVFQDNRLLTDRPVFDNVALPLVISGFKYRDIVKRTSAALDRVGLLSKLRDYPQSLSGGEQQRVSIARAVVARPRLLLADEPTGNLDPAISADIMNLLKRFHESGVSVLLATHDQTLLNNFDYPKMILEKGRLLDKHDLFERQLATQKPAVPNIPRGARITDPNRRQKTQGPSKITSKDA